MLPWGTVVTGSKGYRAQFAYPKSLYLAHKDYRFVGRLRETYRGVSVQLLNPFRTWKVDIGTEEETTVIEPVEDPVPLRREAPDPDLPSAVPAEPAEPVKVSR